MSYSFQLFLFFYVPTTWLLVSFSAAWIFSCSLTLRKNYQHPLLHCYLIFSLLLLPTVIYFWTELHAWLLQIGIFVGLLILFQDSARRKLTYFVFFILIFLTIESTAILLYKLYRYWGNGVLLASFRVEELKTSTDMSVMAVFYFLAAIPVLWKVPQMLKLYSQNPFPIMEIILPIQMASSTQILPMQYQSPYYPVLIAVYWLISLLSYLPLLHGLKRLYQYEKSQALLAKQVEIARKQLDYSNEAQKHYQDLRKWNHDIENHLFALSYLTSHGKYEEASAYLNSIELGGKKDED